MIASRFHTLLSQTAVYGASTVIGRLLNYLLVPIYTRIFLPEEYGVVTEMYAYSAFFLVILSYGLETSFFRFSQESKNKDAVYNVVISSLIATTVVFFGICALFNQKIAGWIQHNDHPEYVLWFAIILCADTLTVAPFARLRLLNKAGRYAIIRFTSIIVNIGLNLFFLVLCPRLEQEGYTIINQVYNSQIGIGYIFISNLAASLFTLLILIPEIIKVKLDFDFALWKKMLRYSLPLLVAGLAGITNETFDRILIKYLLPPETSLYQVGIYGACYKLSIIMTIFIQSFRLAAEPFFFKESSRLNAKKIYADIMKYFVIICTGIFLVIMLFMNEVKYFIGSEFHEGLEIVPILLIANLFLGIYYNLSVWYKLTDNTRYGAYISIAGAFITLAMNFFLIPRIGFIGAAWSTLLCYVSMVVISYILSQKYFSVNYDIGRILFYIFLSVGLYLLSQMIFKNTLINQYLISACVLLIFALFIFISEKTSRIHLSGKV